MSTKEKLLMQDRDAFGKRHQAEVYSLEYILENYSWSDFTERIPKEYHHGFKNTWTIDARDMTVQHHVYTSGTILNNPFELEVYSLSGNEDPWEASWMAYYSHEEFEDLFLENPEDKKKFWDFVKDHKNYPHQTPESFCEENKIDLSEAICEGWTYNMEGCNIQELFEENIRNSYEDFEEVEDDD